MLQFYLKFIRFYEIKNYKYKQFCEKEDVDILDIIINRMIWIIYVFIFQSGLESNLIVGCLISYYKNQTF